MSIIMELAPTHVNLDDTLPSYSRRQHGHMRRHSALPPPRSVGTPEPARRQTEHIFTLSSPSRACLKLFSSAKSSKSLPTFFEKESIAGEFEVDLDRGGSVISVNAVITGKIINGLNDVVFLSETYPLWTRTDEARRGKKDLVLNLPFSIKLPRTIHDSQAKLPETFLERYTKASIQYDLTITVERHGGLMKNDSKIKTAFGYVPSVKAGTPTSIMRQLAYAQHAMVPSPRADPDRNAWVEVTPQVSNIGGKLKGKGSVNVKCVMSLATPLTYARGGVIPLNLCLSSSPNDQTALNVLAQASAAKVVLRRRVVVHVGKSKKPSEDVVMDLVDATFWAGEATPGCRDLDGEIKLPKDLRPSCEIPGFSIQYTVVLLPFETPGYSAPSSKHWPTVEVPVTIGTVHPVGPRAIAYAPPPSYTSSQSRTDDNLSTKYAAPQTSPRSFMFSSTVRAA